MNDPNPAGLCMCGCGKPTEISSRTYSAKGLVKGGHCRYVFGHGFRYRKPPKPFKPAVAEFLIDEETGCWVWNRGLTTGGYGAMRDAHGIKRPAHRVIYERERGPIPVGLDLDHLCRNRRCVNPDHLEPVTRAENIRRGSGTLLDSASVLAIRLLGTGDDALPGTVIAEAFDISPRNVYTILAGQSWRGVLAVTPEEIDLAQAGCRSRAMELLKRARGLRIARESLCWSPRLFD